MTTLPLSPVIILSHGEMDKPVSRILKPCCVPMVPKRINLPFLIEIRLSCANTIFCQRLRL